MYYYVLMFSKYLIQGAHGYNNNIHANMLSGLKWNECYVSLHVGNSLQIHFSLNEPVFVRARRKGATEKWPADALSPNKSTAKILTSSQESRMHTHTHMHHNIKQIGV